MLAIRMQRTGRSGYAMYRVIVQESRRTPTSGKVIAYVGSYNPHTKATILETEKIDFYLSHGAQPTPRVVGLLKSEKIKLPKWIELPTKKSSVVRSPEKLRRNRPETEQTTTPEAVEPQPTEAVADSEPNVVAEEAPTTTEPEEQTQNEETETNNSPSETEAEESVNIESKDS
jgi:small subunit ribosomal protein S16